MQLREKLTLGDCQHVCCQPLPRSVAFPWKSRPAGYSAAAVMWEQSERPRTAASHDQ